MIGSIKVPDKPFKFYVEIEKFNESVYVDNYIDISYISSIFQFYYNINNSILK